MSGRRKSKSHGVFKLKNWKKKKPVEENLDLINRFDKGEEIVDRCCNVRLSHSSMCMICDNQNYRRC
jgi:hypothetical protein